MVLAARAKKSLFSLTLILTSVGPTLALAQGGSAKARSELDSLKFVEGDERSNESRALKAELMVARTEAQAIQQARKLIQRYRGTKLEAELQFRLAELYMRRAKSARFFEIHRESDTSVSVAPQEVKLASSRKSIEEAVATYELIQKNFPRFAELDLVIFNNAFARQQLGQDREAERLYWTLIQNFRQSPLVADSHLAIGEISFERANFSFALEHFNAIRKFPESKVYPYGLYKAAWALYNMREAEKGLKKLEEVVAYGRYVAQNRIDARLDLRKEALADMTVFFEDVHPASKAFSYFKVQAGELEVGPIILKLAKLYEHHSRYADRQVVLEDFVQNLPNDGYIAQVQSEMVWNLDALKKKELAVVELEKLAKLCEPGSKWLQSQARANPKMDVVASCRGMLNETSLKLASRWLKLWKKGPQAGGGDAYADAAERAYAVFLSSTPRDDSEVLEARYAYAELLFQRAKYREASQQYAMVSRSKTGSLRHDAAYAAVVSLEKGVGDKWSDGDEKEFRTLAGEYLTQNPKGQYRLDVEFKTALIDYEKSRYDQAAPVFQRLGREYARTEKGRKAQDIYLDILNIRKDFAALKEYSGQLLAVEKDGARVASLRKIHEQAYFMLVQGLEESGKWEKAVSGYKEFVAKNPTSDLAEKAWWNAIQLQYRNRDLMGAAASSMEYAERFPAAKNSLEALLSAAQSYEALAALPQAAEVLEKVAVRDSKNQLKWLSLAADFYLLSGLSQRAKPILQALQKSDATEFRTGALEKLLLIEKKTGGEGYRQMLELVVRQGVEPQASLARVEILEEQLRRGDLTGAFNEAKRVIGTSAASPSAKSRARFVQARVLEDEFVRQSIKSRAERVATVLAIKTEKLEKAQQAYQQAIKYGDPEVAVQSLQRLAGCYAHYVEGLKAMPLPAGLSEADGQAFRNELTQLVVPLEEKVIETLQEGLRAAKRLQVGGELVSDMRRELKRWNAPAPSEDALTVEDPAVMLPTLAGVGS